MVESATLVPLPQLVDLSLNCSEGLIHFQALHTLLQVIIQQAAMNDVSVEFRGKDSERIQNLISGTKPSAKGSHFTEYTISGQKKRKNSKRTVSLHDVKETAKIGKHGEKLDKIETAREKELRVIERRKNSKEDPDLNPPPLKSPPSSMHGLGTEQSSLQTIVVVDSQTRLPQFSVAMTKDKFDNLLDEVETLKQDLKELRELPGNLDLIEATSKGSPIQDMFQIITLTKRVESSEAGVEKLASLVEDLVKMIPDSTQAVERVREIRASVDKERRRSSAAHVADLGGLEERVTLLEQDVTTLMNVVREEDEPSKEKKQRRTSGARLEEKQEEHHIEKKIQKQKYKQVRKVKSESDEDEEEEEKGKQDKDKENKEEEDKEEEDKDKGSEKEKKKEEEEEEEEDVTETQDKKMQVFNPSGVYHTAIDEEVNLGGMPVNEALELIQKEFENIRAWVDTSLKEVDAKQVPLITGGKSGSKVNLEAFELRIAECTKHIEELDHIYNNQISLLNQQLASLEKEVADILAKVEVILPGDDSTGINAETTMELANKLQLLEKEIIAVSEHAAQLQAEKVERDKSIETIMEQIDVLKIVKANREDLEDALGDKADACQINRKVSHDQFDAACDDLTRGIEEALGRLQEQEDMWRTALETIQRDIGNKLDKNEVDPLRDFVNSKLKALQEKFKSLTALKREQEAAGTKSKLLRDVNCISCDKEVVMRKEMDASLKPKAYAMPPPRNMAPYLAYELDQLRKQQKCVPGSKNLNFLESALKTKMAKDKNHICNRYCGGSHTVTTPQQRVTRLGHFLEQWGPEIAPLHDEYVRGKDGQMYKARDDDAIQKKLSKQQEGSLQQKTSQRGVGSAVMEDKSQPERNTMIDAKAEILLTTESEKSKTSTDPDRKFHSIGSAVQHIEHKTTPTTESVQSEPKPPKSASTEVIPESGSQPGVEAKASHQSKRIGFQE